MRAAKYSQRESLRWASGILRMAARAAGQSLRVSASRTRHSRRLSSKADSGTAANRRADSGRYEATVHSAICASTRPLSGSPNANVFAADGSNASARSGALLARRANAMEATKRLRGVFGQVSSAASGLSKNAAYALACAASAAGRPRAMLRITAGCASLTAKSKRCQRSASLNSPRAASSANGASQLPGRDLPLLRHSACASFVHVLSMRLLAAKAVRRWQRRPASSMLASHKFKKVGHSLRLAIAFSHSLRKASPTASPLCAARNALPRTSGKLSSCLRNEAYSSHAANGWLLKPANARSFKPPRDAASNAAFNAGSGAAILMGERCSSGLGRGLAVCATAVTPHSAIANMATMAEVNLCMT